ncbi:GMC oxidoreductase [Vibrio diabolicus]|uniref:GMC oxidoreductase n=1 Tax=Vibrio diabolicus TaxID=50719 RepID=UPI0015944A48|nr:GMC family oxidoreductase [Vibrio diabolicus]MCS0316080.1 GMC family oxidoreductase [Vibrio diabolicus]NVC50469.1 GMC family oxidoreductase [Vibrio diabolicus]
MEKLAVIIGSGVAGTFVATQILKRSLFDKVIMLEAGSEYQMGDYSQWLNYISGGKVSYEDSYDTEEDYKSIGTQPWYINGGRIIGKGGSALHFGGWLPRFQPEDFELYSRTGQGIDWPFNYDELEPYYCDAEHYLGVSGDSLNQFPVRSKPYPYEPAPYPSVASPFIDAFKKMGMTYQHLPVTRYGRAEDNHGKCLTTGTCEYCPVDGKFNGTQPFRYLETQSGFELRLNSPALRLEMESRERVKAVTYYDVVDETVKMISADAVFICAGALEAPKLLINSPSKYWPHGIGNDYDLVGRYLSANPFFYASGEKEDSIGCFNELGFPTLSSRHYDQPEYQSRGKFFIAMDYNSADTPLVDLMLAGSSKQTIQKQVLGNKRFQLYGNLAPVPHWENRVYPATYKTRHFLPATMIETPTEMYNAESADFYLNKMKQILLNMGLKNLKVGTYPQRGDHAACTCRMADSPENGVVDTQFRVHATHNLYVLSNAVLPTLPAANPTLTLVALGFKMFEQWQTSPSIT